MTASVHTYRLLDVFTILVASSFSYWIRFDVVLMPWNYAIIAIIHAFFVYLSLQAFSFYEDHNSKLTKTVIIRCCSALIFSLFLSSAFLYITKTGESFSRQWLILNCFFSASAILGYRHFLQALIGNKAQLRQIAILGTTTSIRTHRDAELFCEKHGIELAFYSADAKAGLHKLVSLVEDLRQRHQEPKQISEVWITDRVYSGENIEEIQEELLNSAIRIVYMPSLPKGIKVSKQMVAFYGNEITINSRYSSKEKWQTLVKLFEDKLIAIFGIIFLSPVLLAISLIIKLDSKGPAIFSQRRYGLDGREFWVYKFRTMAVSQERATHQAKRDDPRITKIGGFLRRTSLDELPQLFNVLKGDMSIVGPRPHPNDLNEEFRKKVPQYMIRHTIKPGITGLAQINGLRGELTEHDHMSRRVEYDLEYIQNWSLWLDLKIIFMTFEHVISTDKAY